MQITKPQARLTKSDFRQYCEVPRHLWAAKHGRIQAQVSEFDQHLMKQGYEVEGLAHTYLETVFLPANPGCRLLWQKTYTDGPFEARLDALLTKPSGAHDLYEIKSGTGLKNEDIPDVAFQSSILQNQVLVDHYFVLHLNKEYIRSGELDLASLFIAEDITTQVQALLPGVESQRLDALETARASGFSGLAHCLAPRDCPCPDVCHPNLPDFSIYDIPLLRQPKKLELLDLGIRAARDIPASFALNAKQRLVAELARTNTAHVDRPALQAELDQIEYPVHFLDYETCIAAIPPFDGYHPQQQVTFQYSLHRLDQPGGGLAHSGWISITGGDPSLSLLEHLYQDLGDTGTVIVWNKAFEMTRNSEMALLHPEYAGFLEDVNGRIQDLGDVVSKGYYLHPGFKGSWSIKNVLPVMVPELSYQNLPIHKGDQASMAWWKMMFGGLEPAEIEKLMAELSVYCELDTLAMVEIYKALRKIAG